MEFICGYLITISIVCFLVFGLDKYRATYYKRRISETVLLLLSFCGGTAGSVLSMILLRHKISKRTFLLKFAGIALLQIFLIYLIFRAGWI